MVNSDEALNCRALFTDLAVQFDEIGRRILAVPQSATAMKAARRESPDDLLRRATICRLRNEYRQLVERAGKLLVEMHREDRFQDDRLALLVAAHELHEWAWAETHGNLFSVFAGGPRIELDYQGRVVFYEVETRDDGSMTSRPVPFDEGKVDSFLAEWGVYDPVTDPTKYAEIRRFMALQGSSDPPVDPERCQRYADVCRDLAMRCPSNQKDAAALFNATCLDPITLGEAADLMLLAVTTIRKRGKGDRPEADVPPSGKNPARYSYAKLRPWLEKEFPLRASQLPETYEEAKQKLTNDSPKVSKENT